MRNPARLLALARLAAPCLAVATLLGGCHRASEDRIDVALVGDRVGNGEPLTTRGVRLGPGAQLVQAATAQGLVTLDETGQVVPALADRWIVTDDGASYIFRLRDGTWPDGAPIDGQAVARALRRALEALRGTPLGLDLADIGEVRVMTGRVIELRLTRPVPELLQLLAQPELGLLRKDGGDGPLRVVGSGGATSGGAAQAGTVRLVAIPPAQRGLPLGDDEPGADASRPVRYRAVQLHALSAAAATAAFSRGDVALVLGGRFADLPLARAAAGLSRRALQFDPAPGLFGLAVVSQSGPLGAPELREALAMVIDRPALGSALGLSGWSPEAHKLPSATGSGPALGSADEPVAGGPSAPAETGGAGWGALPVEARRAQAAARVARWTSQHGGTALALRLALPGGPGADALFAQLAADFAGIGVALQRVDAAAPTDLRLLDLVARYPGAVWYLNQLSCAARRTICSPPADALLAAAKAEPDPARRSALLGQAEAQLLADNVFLPFATPVRWSLVRNDVTGFAVNAVAFHPLPPLARKSD